MKKHIKKIYDNDNDVISVIIPSAGIGRRMKSYGSKSLLTINKEKLIDIQLRNINNVIPENDTILITGFDSDRLMGQTPHNIIKIENERYYESNVSRSISIGLRATRDNDQVLIIFGDVLFNEQCLKAINKEQSSIIISEHMSDDEVGCNISKKGVLEYMMYDQPNKWGHIMYLTGRELSLFKKLSYAKSNSKKFCFEVMNDVVNAGGRFDCIQDENIKVMDIDTSKDLQKAQEFI